MADDLGEHSVDRQFYDDDYIRQGLIRKVYLILSSQLLLSLFFIGLALTSDHFRVFVTQQTLAESYMLGAICMNYQTEIVLEAIAITAVITFGLTIFTFLSKIDFAAMGPYLFVALIVFVIAGLIRVFFPWTPFMNTVYACIGALLFSLYIIYDTWRLSQKAGPDDAILCALSLYLDIINLFLMILEILGGKK